MILAVDIPEETYCETTVKKIRQSTFYHLCRAEVIFRLASDTHSTGRVGDEAEGFTRSRSVV